MSDEESAAPRPQKDQLQPKSSDGDGGDPSGSRPALHINIPPGGSEKALEIIAASYSGPLPPPGILRAYGDIVPGAPERIIALWESEVAHRHKEESSIVHERLRAVRRGQTFAFLFAMSFLALAAFAIYRGQTLEGLGAALAALAGVIGVFIYRERSEQPVEPSPAPKGKPKKKKG